jgi:diketogulonate reductase-like aldo/keto reductase
MNIDTTIMLSSGTRIPVLGLGVFKAYDDTYTAVRQALDAGYRHIDTAKVYENEEQVGKAIKDSGIDREQIFVTTKLWTDAMRSRRVAGALENSLRLLDMDYVDLYLMHWPLREAEQNAYVYSEIEKLRDQGKIRACGVSNFHIHHLKDLKKLTGLTPEVNQIEIHPYLPNDAVAEYCEKENIAVESWSPLARGKITNETKLLPLATKYGKTVPQIVIRWHLQRGFVVIPKSVKKHRIIENAQVFDFSLSEEEMSFISSLNRNQRTGSNPDDHQF